MLAALCTGVGDVGPKFNTYMLDRGALEVSFCSFLDQLSLKKDGSRTTVSRFPEAFSGSVLNSSRGGSASTFARTRDGAAQHSPMRSGSPAQRTFYFSRPFAALKP